MSSTTKGAASRTDKASHLATGLAVILALIVYAGSATGAPAKQRGNTRPEVTITERDHGLIEEYRIGGRLYMIRINPRKGHPYYLIDSNGDGLFDRHRPEIDEDLFIPAWTLLRWR